MNPSASYPLPPAPGVMGVSSSSATTIVEAPPTDKTAPKELRRIIEQLDMSPRRKPAAILFQAGRAIFDEGRGNLERQILFHNMIRGLAKMLLEKHIPFCVGGIASYFILVRDFDNPKAITEGTLADLISKDEHQTPCLESHGFEKFDEYVAESRDPQKQNQTGLTGTVNAIMLTGPCQDEPAYISSAVNNLPNINFKAFAITADDIKLTLQEQEERLQRAYSGGGREGIKIIQAPTSPTQQKKFYDAAEFALLA